MCKDQVHAYSHSVHLARLAFNHLFISAHGVFYSGLRSRFVLWPLRHRNFKFIAFQQDKFSELTNIHIADYR